MPTELPRYQRHYDGLDRAAEQPDSANRNRIRTTLDLMPSAARTVLDAGCGTGVVHRKLIAAGCDVTATDISLAALRVAPGARVAGSIALLPFADRCFDAVMALEVIEHLPDPAFAAALSELARVADRYLIVSTPNAEHLPSGLAQCAACGAVFHRNLHFRSMDAEDHAHLFDELGFRHRETRPVAEWRQSGAWTRIRRVVGGDHALKAPLVCPRCGVAGAVAPPPGAAVRLGLRLVDGVAWRRLTPIPRWLVSLHERQSPQPTGTSAPS